VNRNIKPLYGFSFFDQFMIVIALWIPYLTTQGITMRQFMELQAVFAIVILSGEVPSGLLSDLVGTEEDPAAGHDAQSRQLFPPAFREQLRGLPLLSPHDGDRAEHDLGWRRGGDLGLVSPRLPQLLDAVVRPVHRRPPSRQCRDRHTRPDDGRSESPVGCASYPRRTLEARHRHR
jgi:hypothetical protein